MSSINFRKDLEKINNAKDLFNVIEQHYDLPNSKIGSLTKIVIIQKIDSIINLIGAKPKK
jgi:hypothetical protein